MSELFIPNLQDFLSLARNRGLARANRFLVEFFPPKNLLGVGITDIINVGMMCEEATFPEKRIETRSLRIAALSEQRAHYVDYKNKEISFRFIVDNLWQSKNFFNQWMSLAINPMSEQGVTPKEVGYYNEYIGGINIFSLTPIFTLNTLNNTESPLYGVRIHEVWPISLGSQTMSSGTEGYHRLTVGFTFKWWEEIPKDEIGGLSNQDVLKKLSEEKWGKRTFASPK